MLRAVKNRTFNQRGQGEMDVYQALKSELRTKEVTKVTKITNVRST